MRATTTDSEAFADGEYVSSGSENEEKIPFNSEDEALHRSGILDVNF